MTEPGARRVARNLGLAVVFIYVSLLGGTVTSQYITGVRAVTAAIGAGFILVWILRAPRRADLVDRLVLGALLLFLVTCLTSQVPRLSLSAGIAATAFTAALFVVRRLAADAAARDFMFTLLGLMGTVLALAYAIFWGAFWVRWISVSGTPPPLDLILPIGAFRHYQVVAMAVTAFLPAVFVLARRPLIWPVAWIGLLASATVILISGTRTVWLALLLVGLAIGARAMLRRKWHLPAPGRRRIWLAGAAAGVVIVAVVLGSSLAARLTTASTVDLRGAIWEATLTGWLQHPLVGWGPGTFSVAITQSGFFDMYEAVGQHADSAPVQLLAETGLAGVAGLVVLASALAVGWRRETGTAPLAGVALLALMSFTNNPTVYAHLVAVGLVWFALATPANVAEPVPATSPRPWRSWLRVATLASASVVALASTLTLAAALAHDRARSAALAGDVGAVVESLQTARTLDPGYPVYWRDSALWLAADGRPDEAILDVGRAIALNPADATAWRIAAYLALQGGAGDEAVAFAQRAEDLRATDAVNALMVAYASDRAGDEAATHSALVRAVRHYPWLPAAPDWSSDPAADLSTLFSDAVRSWAAEPDQSGRWGQAEAWLGALTGNPLPEAATGAIQEAVSLTLTCRLDEASAALDGLSRADRASTGGLLAQILNARARGEVADEPVMLAALRWPLLRLMATGQVAGRSPLVEPDEDLRLYGRYSISAPEYGPIFPTPESGMSAWLVNPAAAADRGAPSSELAGCR